MSDNLTANEVAALRAVAAGTEPEWTNEIYDRLMWKYIDVEMDGSGDLYLSAEGRAALAALAAHDTPPTVDPQPASEGGDVQDVEDSWKFRKLGIGISPTDYRETLSREGLLDYLKEREAWFEEAYQQERDRRKELESKNAGLRQSYLNLAIKLHELTGEHAAPVAVEALEKRLSQLTNENAKLTREISAYIDEYGELGVY